ncbi:MAG TPA: DUF2071 domain-containing protein [Vicinamibacteria bacterium]|nr:DUF2071 domain-containing protein [Vicinamibacteria bacterium]
MNPLDRTEHRPWPLPGSPWVMSMTWRDLAFLHWPVSAAALAARISPGLTLDTFYGDAYLGIVPFHMTGVRPRFVPPLPGLSSFIELNVRTYVSADGKPGVWFFSLDATSRLAVRGARRFFHLPYFDARMSSERRSGFVHYRSERVHRGAPEARFAARYRSTGPAGRSELETWLTERYCLYAETKGAIFRGDIHHRPWPLENGEAEIETVDMTGLLGMDLPRTPPLTHFSERLDVVGWPLLPVERLP